MAPDTFPVEINGISPLRSPEHKLQATKCPSKNAIMNLTPSTAHNQLRGATSIRDQQLMDAWGQWPAIALMIISAVLPYFWFKRKGWL